MTARSLIGFVAGILLAASLSAQVQTERPHYTDEIVPMKGNPFYGKVLKFEGQYVFVQVTKHKVTQVISISLDSLREVRKDFGALKVSVWKREEERTDRPVAAAPPVIKLPPRQYRPTLKDTTAALAVERDSVFVGSIDRLDTSASQKKLVDQMPVPLKRQATEYPPIAFGRHLQGHAKLRIWIDKEGLPQKWEVVECTDSIFVPSSVESVMKWEFAPAVVKGTPVGVWAAVSFEYEIQH
ncbi:MAG TPA: energy transducer TonB [Bacteroidota bacterium]|nr:energy transducer TonB [Bacteroidota bacterium]